METLELAEDQLDACGSLTRELAPEDSLGRLLGYAAGIGHDPREDAYVAREVNREWLYNFAERARLDLAGAERWQHLLTVGSVLELDLTI